MTGDVAQIYVGRLPISSPTPVQQLAGEVRVTLRQVTVTLDPRSLAYWDTGTQRWVTPGGTVPVLAGSSSRDIRLRGVITVAATSSGP